MFAVSAGPLAWARSQHFSLEYPSGALAVRVTKDPLRVPPRYRKDGTHTILSRGLQFLQDLNYFEAAGRFFELHLQV